MIFKFADGEKGPEISVDDELKGFSVQRYERVPLLSTLLFRCPCRLSFLPPSILAYMLHETTGKGLTGVPHLDRITMCNKSGHEKNT